MDNLAGRTVNNRNQVPAVFFQRVCSQRKSNQGFGTFGIGVTDNYIGIPVKVRYI